MTRLRRVSLPLFLLAAASLAACQSTAPGHDLELSTGVVGLPGAGASLGLSQRLWESDSLRVDFEVDVVVQALKDAITGNGDTGNDLKQMRFGVRLRRPGDEGARWVGRIGATWMRFQGDPVYLDDPLDYGGLYLGVGYEMPVGERWVMGPRVTAHIVASEGSGGSGVVPELAWHFIYRF